MPRTAAAPTFCPARGGLLAYLLTVAVVSESERPILDRPKVSTLCRRSLSFVATFGAAAVGAWRRTLIRRVFCSVWVALVLSICY